MRSKIARLILLSSLVAACSSNRVIRDHEYDASLNAYRRGDVGEALDKFPSGEQGGLITSVEKSWLSLWEQNWNPAPLQQQVDTFDSRNFTSLSREAGYFLMQEAEEGYVPAEHEIVILHLLSATHFLQLGRLEDGKVELRRAGYVLDRYWDDPALRLWLGSLWVSAGQWNEAQVDFRRANALRPNQELERFAEGPPVRELALEFSGVGPAMQWKEGHYTPQFSEAQQPPEMELAGASTLTWFERHSQRNTDLRDSLVKSNFMAQYLGGKAVTGTERGLSFAAGVTIKTIAVAIGAAVVGTILYVGVMATGSTPNSEQLGAIFGAGIGTSSYIWKAGDQLEDHLDHSIAQSELSKQKDLKIYRVARFLPGWIGLNLTVREGSSARAISLKKVGDTQVLLVNHF